MLKIVGQDTDQPHAERDRRVPALVNDAFEVARGQAPEECEVWACVAS